LEIIKKESPQLGGPWLFLVKLKYD